MAKDRTFRRIYWLDTQEPGLVKAKAQTVLKTFKLLLQLLMKFGCSQNYSKAVQKDPSQFRVFFIVFVCICGGISFHVNAFAQDYHMSCDNGLITLSADKVDLKTILLSITKETNIFIQFPKALQKQITIELSDVSIRNALKRLLLGYDYAIIYSASKKSNPNSISKVYVLPEQWGHRKPASSQIKSPKANNLLRNYNRRLDSLRDRLTKVERGSHTERRILRQIQSIEKTVERLEKRVR
jgi:hypothetical protein